MAHIKLITDGLVVTMDDAGTIHENGAVAIRDSAIVAVGSTVDVTAQFETDDAEVIDARGHLVLPGLINTHSHAADTLFRGFVDDLPLEPWLERLWSVESRFVRAETVRAAARLAFVEMIRGGITTALDMFFFANASTESARHVGFRLATGPTFFERKVVGTPSAKDSLARCREFLEQYRRDPLIIPCVLAHSTYTVSPELLKECRALVEEFDVPFHTHVSETAAEVATVKEMHGTTPPRHLDSLGLVTAQSVFAHCVHLSQDEIDLFADRGATVAHCPLSNLKLGSGVAPIPSMTKAAVRVTLGTDGPVSGNDLDMWLAMRLTGVLHKGVNHDAAALPAAQVVRFATTDAAAALGLGDKIGSLEAGKRADVILIDLERPHLTPMYDVYSHLVYAVGRDDVRTVIINGRTIFREGRFTELDEAAVMAEVEEIAGEIRAVREH